MVLRLVILEIARCIRLVTQTNAVYYLDTAFPVSGEDVSRRRAVYVILASCEIPHEITPVHPIHLIVEEERKVLEESRLLMISTHYRYASLAHI